MPYEKSIFNHLFDDAISSMSNLNTTNYISINSYINTNNCDKYQNRLDTDNEKLRNVCFIYIASSSSLFFAVFLRDIWKSYASYTLLTTVPSSPRYDSKSAIASFGSFQSFNDYKKNDDKGETIEMISPPKNIKTQTDITTEIIENPTFIKYYWHNSGFLAELIKTVEFIILVSIFEYLFFAYIVNKFKIADSKTILCGIYNKALT